MLKTDLHALKEYLKKLGVYLAYHKDPQGQPHLAVVREDSEKKQLGSYLWPNVQYDLYDLCPEKSVEYFATLNTDEVFMGIHPPLSEVIAKIDEAIKRL